MRARPAAARLVVAALAALAVAVAIAGPAVAASKPPLRCNGSAALCDRPFDQVVIPATHNSMSAQALGWQIPSQQLSIPDQLRAGIRGFLIDTFYGHRQADGSVVNDPVKTPQSNLYVCHA